MLMNSNSDKRVVFELSYLFSPCNPSYHAVHVGTAARFLETEGIKRGLVKSKKAGSDLFDSLDTIHKICARTTTDPGLELTELPDVFSAAAKQLTQHASFYEKVTLEGEEALELWNTKFLGDTYDERTHSRPLEQNLNRLAGKISAVEEGIRVILKSAVRARYIKLDR